MSCRRISAQECAAATLLPAIESGNVSITDEWMLTPVRSEPVYRQQEVAAWLLQWLKHAQCLPASALAGLDVTAADWYIQRKQDFFGPLSILQLSMLCRNGALDATDTCFSLRHGGTLSVSEAESFGRSSARGLDTKRFHTNRRQKRVRANIVSIVALGEMLHSAITLDLSEGGAAVVVRHDLAVGAEVTFMIPANERWPVFEATAVIVSGTSYGDSKRYGLKFGRLSRQQRDALIRRFKSS